MLDVKTYKAARLDVRSAVTFNIGFRTLAAAFNRALKWGLIKDNPFLKSKQVRVPEKAPVPFSRAEFDRFIAVVKEPVLKDLFVFALLTGSRRGEILNLRESDIDLDQKLIRITSRDGFLTKTGRSRIIPMSDEVFELLKKLRSLSDAEEHVFAAAEEKLKASYVSHKFKRYVRSTHLKDELKFHSPRHYAELGISVIRLQLGSYRVERPSMRSKNS